MTTTTPAGDWGTVDIYANRTIEYRFKLYEGDGETPLVVEATDLFRFFLWDTDGESPSDLNCNSGAASATFSASSGTFTSNNHKLDNGAAVQLSNSGGALPSAFATQTTYYVVNRTEDTFQLSATRGGSAITSGDDGTGTHTWTRGSKITVESVGVTDTTPAQVLLTLHEWDTNTLTADTVYDGQLVLVDDDDGDAAKIALVGKMVCQGSGGGELGLGG